jgi:hypothetical protein
MAAPEQIAQIRADAAARLSRSAPALARSLGVEPPAAVAGEAAKHPALREARTLESLADFIDRADVAAYEAVRVCGIASEQAKRLQADLDAAVSALSERDAGKRRGK